MAMPRFTLTMTLRDNQSHDPPITMAIGVDDECRISARAVDEMKAGILDYAATSLDQTATVRMMKVREFRKSLFKRAAERLGALLAERMEDAEGWHDTSRIEPARKQLGGRWE